MSCLPDIMLMGHCGVILWGRRRNTGIFEETGELPLEIQLTTKAIAMVWSPQENA